MISFFHFSKLPIYFGSVGVKDCFPLRNSLSKVREKIIVLEKKARLNIHNSDKLYYMTKKLYYTNSINTHNFELLILYDINYHTIRMTLYQSSRLLVWMNIIDFFSYVGTSYYMKIIIVLYY